MNWTWFCLLVASFVWGVVSGMVLGRMLASAAKGDR